MDTSEPFRPTLNRFAPVGRRSYKDLIMKLSSTNRSNISDRCKAPSQVVYLDPFSILCTSYFIEYHATSLFTGNVRPPFDIAMMRPPSLGMSVPYHFLQFKYFIHCTVLAIFFQSLVLAALAFHRVASHAFLLKILYHRREW